MAQPKWATPERQARLVQLWESLGNKCLQGHPVCPHLDHYLYTEDKRVMVGKGVPVVAVDKAKEPRRDEDGNRIVVVFWGEKPIIVQLTKADTLYGKLSEEAIEHWKADDREKTSYLWKQERLHLHSQPEFLKRGQFDSLAKEIFLAERPLWEIVEVGVGAFTFQRVFKVRIPALHREIWVNLPAPQGLSRNKRKKIRKYGKGVLPQPDEDLVYRVISKAVQRVLSN